MSGTDSLDKRAFSACRSGTPEWDHDDRKAISVSTTEARHAAPPVLSAKLHNNAALVTDSSVLFGAALSAATRPTQDHDDNGSVPIRIYPYHHNPSRGARQATVGFPSDPIVHALSSQAWTRRRGRLVSALRWFPLKRRHNILVLRMPHLHRLCELENWTCEEAAYAARSPLVMTFFSYAMYVRMYVCMYTHM